ncbi:MAG: prephenate dehydrogenase/arogenate dehydrogenase family protein [Vicinamibacterales bacterium]
MPPDTQPIRFVRSGADAQPPPAPFRNIAVLGLGDRGLSLALAARRRWPAALVIGVDLHGRLERAVRLHAIDVGAPDLSILGGAQLIVLACPFGERLGHIQRLCDYVEGDFLVTDLGGPKAVLFERARALDRLTFIGGHPVLHPASAGSRISAERFDGIHWFLVPDPARPRPEAVECLESFVMALGARPEQLAPEEYERRLAVSNGLKAPDSEGDDD